MDIVDELIIMFTRNKTSEWRDTFRKKLKKSNELYEKFKETVKVCVFCKKKKSRSKELELQNFEKVWKEKQRKKHLR